MKKGERIIIIEGPFRDEQATVTAHPTSGNHEDVGNGVVWIKFDRDNEVIHHNPHLVLYQQWYETRRMRSLNE